MYGKIPHGIFLSNLLGKGGEKVFAKKMKNIGYRKLIVFRFTHAESRNIGKLNEMYRNIVN